MMSPLLLLSALPAFALTVAAAEADSLCLLQQHAQVSRNMAIELGNTAPVSEHGYQLVAAQNSDEEMKAFIHRVLSSEARYVRETSELNGLVPFYSGTQNVQDLESMKKELRSAPWVAPGEGRTAPLNHVGYQKVAALKSNAHMAAFARRILDLNNKVCADEGALQGLVPHFSGEVAVQSFDQLNNELLSAPWAVAPGSVSVQPAATPSVVLAAKATEDPEAEAEEVVETTLATTTAATTTLATTTLATTTLATTTLATTTLATTTLATTTLATTTLATTTLPTTTLAEEEEAEEEEALAAEAPEDPEDVSFISEDEPKKTKEAKADDGEVLAAKKQAKANATKDKHMNTSKDVKANATKKDANTTATKDVAVSAVGKDAKKKLNETKVEEKSNHSWFGWLTR